jgi:O-antigen/teichoic acid export membrane protein
MTLALALIGQWKRLRASGYARGIAHLLGGQGIASLLPFLTSPILGRLYTPLDYSGLVIYMAVANVLTVVATLQIHQGIIIEARQSRAAILVWLALIVSIGVAGGVALIELGYWAIFGIRGPGWPWLFLLPLTTIQLGLASTSTIFANHLRNYKFLARVQVVQIGVTSLVSILLGLRNLGSAGLFIGYFAGLLAQSCVHIWLLLRFGRPWSWPGVARLAVLGRKYRRFPLYTVPSEFLLAGMMQLPLFALNMIGASATVGAFGRARQLVSLPVNVIGGSVEMVFMREAAEQYRTTGSCRKLVLRTSGGLLLVAIVPVCVLWLFAPELFTIYLGRNWTEAGEIAQILAPMLLIRFVAAPVAAVFWFSGHQRLEFVITCASSIFLIALMASCYAAYGTTHSIVVAYAAVYAVTYFAYLAGSLILSSNVRAHAEVLRVAGS